MTLEEYLAFEEQSPIKHEYVAGEVYAMSGVTLRHNVITLNLVRHLHGPARRRGCSVLATDVKLQTADRVYYPDVMVACGKAAQVELIVEEPTFLAEVTSRSTRATDRREKLEAYKQIAPLRCYLIVDQRREHVIAYTRDAGGEWARDEIAGDGEVAIAGLDLRLTTAEIYEDVPLPPLGVREGEEWEAEEWLDAEAR
jgi:Uma2 family endonuclease